MGWRVREDFCCCCCWVLTLYTCMYRFFQNLSLCLSLSRPIFLTIICDYHHSHWSKQCIYLCVVCFHLCSLVSTCVLLGSVGGWLYGSWWCFNNFFFFFFSFFTQFYKILNTITIEIDSRVETQGRRHLKVRVVAGLPWPNFFLNIYIMI